ncbi:hypothetical protein SCLCIDRAFT_1216316 [Scleroderma citrinum Foug A]|uniref:Uncharacterized protein n=1 Tax=Scleroderma citrinum Foug A TaxID=1036808 RepID=A0A0C3DXW6_9AGAM|nr:hypothetical protein SCLCIDRAFT_1216316 [Scleroderma citrinum Foug A]
MIINRNQNNEHKEEGDNKRQRRQYCDNDDDDLSLPALLQSHATMTTTWVADRQTIMTMTILYERRDPYKFQRSL